MMRTLLLVITCWTISASPAPAALASDLPADDLRQVRDIFQQWEQAWNRHDMHAFARLFHDDATWVVWTGRVWKGRDAIEQGHVDAHRTFFRSSTQLSAPEEIRLIAPGVAVARSLTTLTGDAREPEATIRGRKLLVLTKDEGVWKILYGQNTRLTPALAGAPHQASAERRQSRTEARSLHHRSRQPHR